MNKIILALGLVLATNSFAHDDIAIDYAENVAPILIEQCQMCHRKWHSTVGYEQLSNCTRICSCNA